MDPFVRYQEDVSLLLSVLQFHDLLAVWRVGAQCTIIPVESQLGIER